MKLVIHILRLIPTFNANSNLRIEHVISDTINIGIGQMNVHANWLL